LDNFTPPYTKLASIYDHLMNHVDYKEWNNYIKKLFNYAKTEVIHVLDLACGTGNLLAHLRGESFLVTGCDLSSEMLFQAKLKKSLQKISLFCCDVRTIPIKQANFDAVIFLYDSINYILDRNDILQIFIEVEKILQIGGVFIFDTITVMHCKKYFNNHYYNEFWKNYGYSQQSNFKEKESLQYTEFKIYINHKIFVEKHKQRIYSIDDFLKLIEISNFELCGIFENFTLTEYQTDSERIHFVLRKPL
jgi:ubiquinone/menaquinone biosynthesis C-methylase UbiE